VAHLHYKTMYYEDGNELIYLCNNCHLKTHFFGGDKSKKREMTTDRDFALMCRKLQSIRSKNGIKLTNDKVASIANGLY
jgi:hypothetical protein